MNRFLAVRFALDIGPTTLYQHVLADFILEGHFARHIRRMRSVYSERRSMLVENLRAQLGSSAEIAGAQAGLHLALMMKGISDRKISLSAEARKLLLTPLSPFYMDAPVKQGFILGFGGTPPSKMPEARDNETCRSARQANW